MFLFLDPAVARVLRFNWINGIDGPSLIPGGTVAASSGPCGNEGPRSLPPLSPEKPERGPWAAELDNASVLFFVYISGSVLAICFLFHFSHENSPLGDLHYTN